MKYTVDVRVDVSFEFEVEADSEKEAHKRARELVGDELMVNNWTVRQMYVEPSEDEDENQT